MHRKNNVFRYKGYNVLVKPCLQYTGNLWWTACLTADRQVCVTAPTREEAKKEIKKLISNL